MSLLNELKTGASFLTEEELNNLHSELLSIGVENGCDMKFVKEEDLSLKPIHARKLLAYFKGDCLYTADEFEVAVDGKLLFKRIPSFLSAVTVLFGTYYVFGIQYPIQAGCTMEFMQRCMVQINPREGRKVERVKGKNPSIAKVYSFIKELSFNEWTDECLESKTS